LILQLCYDGHTVFKIFVIYKSRRAEETKILKKIKKTMEVKAVNEKEAERMPVIYLNERRHLTKEQKEMAKVALENEINEIMADLEIMEEELDKTAMFGELDLRGIASEYLKQRVKKNTDGSYDEELLKRVYRWYFQE